MLFLFDKLTTSLIACVLEYSVALAGLITFLHASFDMKTFVLGKFHYVLYFLVLAMQVKPQFNFLHSDYFKRKRCR